MILSDVSIKRPVFAVMMVAALLVLGVASYFALSVDLFPEIDFPFVVVSVVYPGAGAEAVEIDVTKKIEDAVNTISGIKHIQSTSQEGFSLTFVEFSLETDPLDAAADVRDKLATVRADLPEDIEEPLIQRYDPESRPFMSLAISGTQTARDLTDYIDDNIRPRLESVTGVGAATIVGGAEREIQVRLYPDKLKSFDISPSLIAAKLQMANVEIPAGRMVDQRREWILRTMGRFSTVNEIRNLVILSPQGRMVRLSEIADVLDTEKEPTSASRLNGQPSIGLDIRRQTGANTVKVSDEVKAVLAKVTEELPAGMKIVMARDDSKFIRDAIDDVLINIIYGGTLAVLVIFLFLANLRSTIISAIAIPASIIATFTLMRMLDFTINMMTLLGLSLAVGLLIDDAIVVIENIYRHMEMKKHPVEASREATNEIGLAVTATTFSIVVVFLPVAFMSGIVGRFFYSFGMTVAFAVAVSLFVAFTLTPMLSSRFLKFQTSGHETAGRGVVGWWNRGFRHAQEAWYRPMLRWCLNNRFKTLVLAFLTFVASMALGPFIGSEFLPQTDESYFNITFEGQAGDKLSTTIEQIQPVEKMLMARPEVVSVLTTIGDDPNPVYSGSISIQLVDKSERDMSAMELIKIARAELKAVPGYFFTVELEESEGGGRPVELSVRGHDLAELDKYTEILRDSIENIPGLVDLKSSQEAGKPEMRLHIDRDLASDLGISPLDVAQTMRLFIDGDEVSRFREGEDEYDIRLQIAEQFRHDPQSIGTLPIPSAKEVPGRDRFTVPLAQIARIEKASGPSQIKRYDRIREVRLSGSVVDRPAGDVRADIFAVTQGVSLPTGYTITAVGEAEIQAESFTNILIALALAIIFIYLVLASQYNSFLDPLSIMVSLPLAVVGAMVSLFLFRSPFSIMSLIGIVLLMGLVSKNGILLIDFAKQRREKGMPRDEAILEAGPVRFRPIIMTSLATILGAVPLALAIGSGAEFRAPIARAVIGGMISSTMLTLLVIPVVYTYFDDLAHGNFRAILGMKSKRVEPAD